MRTRDVIKYSVAGSIAIGTIACIIALEVAKQGRRSDDPQRQRSIQSTLDTFGQTDRPPTAPPPQPSGN
jgi:hypothetical protein